MKQIVIKGGKELTGTIKIGGAKNSAVALIPAAILTSEKIEIANVPGISDVDSLSDILEYLGVKVSRDGDIFKLDPTHIENHELTEDISSKLRASYYFMGSLLGRYKKATMYFPGGCSIGKRPIDLHLKGFEALGAKVTVDGNKYVLEASELKGAHIYLDIASVGATINIMLAAVLAKGKTVIENAAKEPEIVNVATFLNNMGAKITGAGTSEITIDGVLKLYGGFHEVIPDRIEAGTYMIMGAIAGKNLKIANIIPEHLDSLTSKLEEAGVTIEKGDDYFVISRPSKLKGVKITTQVYPGFPTDLQQPLAAFLTQCEGKSEIDETIWENRFMNIPYLNDMGANITVNETLATIYGPTKLIGKEVVATDLRAGACMVLAGLAASGETHIRSIEHVLRGYENIIEKLASVGADITFKD